MNNSPITLAVILGCSWFAAAAAQTDATVPSVHRQLELNLSNTGPAIVGSNIVFQASLQSSTSDEPRDEKFFKYEWHSSVDHLTMTQRADFNTSFRPCYLWFDPGYYEMTVRVYDLKDKDHRLVATKSESFQMTESLNGNMNISQKLSYKLPETLNIYSTGRPIILHLNLTDKFKEKPNFTYNWYIDNIETSTNTPELTTKIPFSGNHIISVRAETLSVRNCDGYIDTDGLKKWFNSTIILKDPVEILNISGASPVKLNSHVCIKLELSGSPPFRLCWELTSATNTSDVVEHSCSSHNKTLYEINLENSPGIGQYVFNFTVQNDVSMVKKQHNLTVTDDDAVPSDSAAVILIPVVGGLVLVTLILVVVVYTMKYHMKVKNVEVADFDFHPTVPLSRSGEYTKSLWDNCKDTFAKIIPKHHRDCGDGATGREERLNASNRGLLPVNQKRRYGSMGNSVKHNIPSIV